MQEIIEKYKRWKADNPDPAYQYDMIHDFFDGELSRGDMQSLAEFAEERFAPTNSTMDAIAGLLFHLENKGGVTVKVDKNGGVRPATDAESIMWNILRQVANGELAIQTGEE